MQCQIWEKQVRYPTQAIFQQATVTLQQQQVLGQVSPGKASKTHFFSVVDSSALFMCHLGRNSLTDVYQLSPEPLVACTI